MIAEEKHSLYASAFAFYRQQNYAVSETVFRKLCVQFPLEASLWRGLAASLQMQNKWIEALHAWGIAALLNEEDPFPHFHAAECFFSTGEKEEAKKALNQAEQRASEDQEDLVENINLLKQLLLLG